MSTKRLGLIAGLTFCLALSLPCSSTAGDINGTWNGVVSFSIQDYQNLQLVGSSSGSVAGQMSLAYDSSVHTMSMSIGEFQIIGDQLFDPFGPNAATGTMFGDVSPGPGYDGAPIGNYSVDYLSILPDGSIDASSGFAAGDLSIVTLTPFGTGEIIFLSFHTVPEPSSIVLAAPAVLAIGVVGWMQRPRRRLWSRLA